MPDSRATRTPAVLYKCVSAHPTGPAAACPPSTTLQASDLPRDRQTDGHMHTNPHSAAAHPAALLAPFSGPAQAKPLGFCRQQLQT